MKLTEIQKIPKPVLAALVVLIAVVSLSLLSIFVPVPITTVQGASQEQHTHPIGEIYGGISVGQSFVAGEDGLSRIDVKLATYARFNTEDVIFTLREAGKPEGIVTITIPGPQIRDNAYHRFEFAPIPDSAGKTYIITFTSPTSSYGNAITVWFNYEGDGKPDAYPDGTCFINNNPFPGDLSFRTYYSQTIQEVIQSFLEKQGMNVLYGTLALLFIIGLIVLLSRYPSYRSEMSRLYRWLHGILIAIAYSLGLRKEDIREGGKKPSLIPAEYRDDPALFKTLMTLFFGGLLARLVLMPITFHSDLLSAYHRSHLLIEGNLLYLNPHGLIQAAGVTIFSYIADIGRYIGWTGADAATTSFWVGTLTTTEIFRAVFLMKLPYLLFDLLICLVILSLFRRDVRKGVLAFGLWFFNPILLFGIYIYGLSEVIPIFFILVCIWLLQEGRIHLASLFLGIAILDQPFLLLLLPLLLILYSPELKEKLKLAAICILPLFISTMIVGIYIAYADLLALIREFSYAPAELLILSLGIIGYVCLLVFIRSRVQNMDSGLNIRRMSNGLLRAFIASSLAVMLLLAALSSIYSVFLPVFSIEYFTWIVPFLALTLGFSFDALLLNLHSIQVIAFIASAFAFGPEFSTWLFASINPAVILALPTPVAIIEESLPWLPMTAIILIAVFAITLAMIVRIFYIFKEEGGKSHFSPGGTLP